MDGHQPKLGRLVKGFTEEIIITTNKVTLNRCDVNTLNKTILITMTPTTKSINTQYKRVTYQLPLPINI